MNKTRAIAMYLSCLTCAASANNADMPWIGLSTDGKGFATDEGRVFNPWGFNYDHDESGRLIEDYWEQEWPRVVGDFKEMKALGANVVRVHIQFGKFMEGPDRPNQAPLKRLAMLVELAEDLGLYLDLTGLGCYHKKDVPAWYDALDEKGRWAAQAEFWEAVARVCASSPAIFCYDLMNEPVSPAGPPKTDWLGPAFGDKHFVQYISLDQAGRDRSEIARRWIETLVAAIRKHDKRSLITVGLVDWSLGRPGLQSGFVPSKVAGPLDFVSVHIYPESGKLDEALETLKGFNVGKPVVVEEIFALRCTTVELGRFMDMAAAHAQGWVMFYWGKSQDELKASGTFADAVLLQNLQLFESRSPERGKN